MGKALSGELSCPYDRSCYIVNDHYLRAWFFFFFFFWGGGGGGGGGEHVALVFYVHGKHLRSCRDGQLT